jgi:hypothetical protein
MDVPAGDVGQHWMLTRNDHHAREPLTAALLPATIVPIPMQARNAHNATKGGEKGCLIQTLQACSCDALPWGMYGLGRRDLQRTEWPPADDLIKVLEP